MDRQTLRDWVHRFNDQGPVGLSDVHAGGVEPRLSPEKLAELAAIVEAGPDREKDGVVRWRRVDLQRVVKERFTLWGLAMTSVMTGIEVMSTIARIVASNAQARLTPANRIGECFMETPSPKLPALRSIVALMNVTPLSSAILAVAVFTSLDPARADAVADFYRGRTVTVLVGVSVGGEYDILTRLMARHIGKQIPGSPTAVAQNMLGAGGMTMANWMYNLGPKDGTHLGVIQNGLPTQQAIGANGVQFDAARFNWIGSISATVETLALWKGSQIGSAAEMLTKETIIGTVGKSNISYGFPAMMKELYGAKIRIVSGYPGGNDINLAMERGEVHGRNNTWSSWKATKPAWLASGDLRIVAYEGPPQADLLGVPILQQLMKTDDERAIVRLVAAGAQLGRPLATGPDVPADRVAALRTAFDVMVKDPDFLKEAASLNFDVAPVRGEAMQKIVTDVLATPKPLRERARPIIE